MNRLAAILPASNVLVDVDATSKKRAFEHAGLVFENQHAIARATVTDNLFARERLGSTGLGHGVAIPHGRCARLTSATGAFLRLGEPVDFNAPDGQPVDLVFALVVPEHFPQQHLMLLSVEKLKEKDRRQKAEVTLHVKGRDIFVEQCSEDLYAAIDQLMDKLDRQVCRHKDKVQNHHHDSQKRADQPTL